MQSHTLPPQLPRPLHPYLDHHLSCLRSLLMATASEHDHRPSSVSIPSIPFTIKEIADSTTHLSSIPSSYAHPHDSHDNNTDHNSKISDPSLSDPIPIIDYSLLNSPDPSERSKAVQELGKACQDWGCFMLVNHGVPEELMERMIEGAKGFFNLSLEEKREFQGKHLLDPIRCGTSVNLSVETRHYWRDFVKIFVHPRFHFPYKPPGFSDLGREYCEKAREVAKGLVRGASTSLGLEEDYLDKSLRFSSEGVQIFTVNYYPPCPQPDSAMGLPAHSDHGLFTLLAQNEIGGLHVEHDGKWVPVLNPVPNSFIVNVGDQLEVVSNGRYKSPVHKAVVNNRDLRISIAIANGPSLDSTVSPAPDLISSSPSGTSRPSYKPMKYREYLELQQGTKLDRKTCLDNVRIN